MVTVHFLLVSRAQEIVLKRFDAVEDSLNVFLWAGPQVLGDRQLGDGKAKRKKRRTRHLILTPEFDRVSAC